MQCETAVDTRLRHRMLGAIHSLPYSRGESQQISHLPLANEMESNNPKAENEF